MIEESKGDKRMTYGELIARFDEMLGRDNAKGQVEKYEENLNAEQIILENLRSRLSKLKEDLSLAESIDILDFLEEVVYVLNHSGETQGYATMGEEITTDYGYVDEFLDGVEEVLLKRNK